MPPIPMPLASMVVVAAAMGMGAAAGCANGSTVPPPKLPLFGGVLLFGAALKAANGSLLAPNGSLLAPYGALLVVTVANGSLAAAPNG